MPIIQFTQADVLRGKTLEDGWYSWEIQPVPAPTQNKKGDGYNYNVTFRLIECKNEDLNGKEIQRVFSNKAISMMIPLIAAARGIKLDEIPPENFQIDTDEIAGKKIDGQCARETYEGQLKNVLDIYAPYKSIVGQAAAF